MISVQSSIRAEVSRRKSLAPEGAEAFSAYAIAAAKGLIPEMEDAAYLTLFQPMTFEIFGEGLRLFQGWALRDLVSFRKRYKDDLVACIDSLLNVQPPGPSSIWVGCPEVMPTGSPWETHQQDRVLPGWLYQLFSESQNDWKHRNFTRPLRVPNPPGSTSAVRLAYVTSLISHGTCGFCSGVDRMHGLTYCMEMENKLAEARKKVSYSFCFLSIAN
jgi:hypothetical protein